MGERNTEFGVRTIEPSFQHATTSHGGPSLRSWLVTLSLHLLICKNGYNYIHPTVALQINSRVSQIS